MHCCQYLIELQVWPTVAPDRISSHRGTRSAHPAPCSIPHPAPHPLHTSLSPSNPELCLMNRMHVRRDRIIFDKYFSLRIRRLHLTLASCNPSHAPSRAPYHLPCCMQENKGGKCFNSIALDTSSQSGRRVQAMAHSGMPQSPPPPSCHAPYLVLGVLCSVRHVA